MVFLALLPGFTQNSFTKKLSTIHVLQAYETQHVFL